MKQYKRPLHVTVDVDQPSTIELTLHETVRLDRVRETERGTVAEQHGELLVPGTRTIALAPGRFSFKTMTDADLRVVLGGAQTTISVDDPKDPWPKPDASPQPGTRPASLGRGDLRTDDTPTLTFSKEA